MDIQNTDIILASSSRYRKKMLEDFGLTCRAIPPNFDEEAHKDPKLDPVKLCEKLSLLKAQSLIPSFPKSLIIGADQLVNFNGRILGKGGDMEQATKQLLELSNNSHQLVTSMTVILEGKVITSTNITTLTMRPLNYKQASAFVMRDQAWDCAGSYKLELSGAALFTKIETADHSAIIGLPLLLLTQALIDLGFHIPFFSSSNERLRT